MPSTVAVIASAIALSACGNETHENKPRPPVPVDVTVSLARDQVHISPAIVSILGKPQMNISQNANAPRNQSNPKAPQAVRVTIANLLPVKNKLFLEGAVDRSISVTPSGSANFTVALPTGVYRLSSPLSRKTALLAVGRSRESSASDVLTP